MTEKLENLTEDEALDAVSGGVRRGSSHGSGNTVGTIVVRECPKCGVICKHTAYSGGRVCCSNCGHTYIK